MSGAKVAVITGASSGIGRALAIEAARSGYNIVGVARDQADLEGVQQEITAMGGACAIVTTDVVDRSASKRIVECALEHFGGIDVVVHCAGFARAGLLLEQSETEIDLQWQVHVAAPLRITRAALPHLRERGGQVMFVGSGLSRVPAPYYGAYCAAKAAVRALSVQLYRELRGTGIAVTFVDPGSVRTNFAATAGIPAYGPSWGPVQPALVAKRMLRAMRTRPARLNAVPLHALATMLGEWFPRMTDNAVTPPVAPVILSEASNASEDTSRHAELATSCHPERSAEGAQSKGEFDRALEPIARRLERVKLPQTFLAELLQPGSDVVLGEAAMRWAGMPNKNERAALGEALDALTTGGFLERTGEERWHVLRSAVTQ